MMTDDCRPTAAPLPPGSSHHHCRPPLVEGGSGNSGVPTVNHGAAVGPIWVLQSTAGRPLTRLTDQPSQFGATSKCVESFEASDAAKCAISFFIGDPERTAPADRKSVV